MISYGLLANLTGYNNLYSLYPWHEFRSAQNLASLNSTQQARWPPAQCTGMPNTQDNIQLQLFLHSRAPWYNNSMRLIVGLLYLPSNNIFGLLRLNNLISRPFFKPIQPLLYFCQLCQLCIVNGLTSILYIKYTTSLQ